MSGGAGSYYANRPIIMRIIRDMKPQSILDIGVGSGFYGEMIRRDLPDVRLDGLETFDYENPLWKNYDHIYREDARVRQYEPYDLFLMVDIIEHMSIVEGRALLDRLPGYVLVSTPWHYAQGPDENPLQAHVSEWKLVDFKGYRYKDFSNYLSAIVLVDHRPQLDGR
jgi:hypothetical protein